MSCPSASFCVAVDSNVISGYGYAVTFNGSSWSAPTLIDGTGGLNSVSCASASFCVAVDSNANALTFNGSSWSAPTPLFGGGDAETRRLTSVSCPSATFCATVDHRDVALTFNGSSWSFAGIDGAGALTSVSCPSASFCVAVDHGYQIGYEFYPGNHAVTFNGSAWSAPTTIDTAGVLTSVSCASESFCVAVDHDGSGVTRSGNALSFNGSTWSAPQKIDDTNNLVSVSCPTVAFCMAIDIGTDGFFRYFILHDVTPTPAPVNVPPPPISGSAPQGQTAPAAPTSARVRAALLRVLAPSGKRARIGQLLKHRGYSCSFTAPSAGRLVISWYLVPKGAHITKAKKPVLVATANATFRKAGPAKIKIVLTASGRKLLKGVKHLKLTAKGTFTPTGQAATSTTKTFTLKR